MGQWDDIKKAYREGRDGTTETVSAEDKYAGADLATVTAAAEAGEVEAQTELALRYGDGNGVAQDKGKAFYWLGKAAAQGDGFAQLLFGNYYLHGTGTTPDEAKAFEWFQKAAVTQPDGMAELALCYLEGRGTPADEAKGREMLAEAAARGSGVAVEEMQERGISTGKPAGKKTVWSVVGAVAGGLIGLIFGWLGLLIGAVAGYFVGTLVSKYVKPKGK